MALTPFLWGRNGQKLTPEQVAREREAASVMAKGAVDFSPVGHWSQGLGRVVQGLMAGYDMRNADRAEQEGMQAADDVVAALLGPGASSFVPQPALLDAAGIPDVNVPRVPVGPHSSDPRRDVSGAFAGSAAASGQNFPMSLVQSESGGNWQALNNEGYGGRLQFGKDRLADAARAGVIPAGMTGAQFSQLPPEAQQAVEQWHFADIDRQAERMGLNSYIGQTVAGIPITQDGIRAMAHLGGIGGAAKFLQSGGQYNPADSNGTSLADYAIKHGGRGGVASIGGAGAPSATGVSPVVAALMQASSNPWVQQKYGPVIQALMGQEMQRQNAAYEQQLRQQDPMYQAQLARLTAPAPVDPWAGVQEINGQLVQMTPQGPQVIGDYRTAEAPYQTVSGETAAALGLDPKNAYNVSPDGKITQIGGGGVTVNMGGEGQRMGGIPSGYTAVEDPSNPSGFRLEAIPGGPAAAEAQQVAGEQASAVAQADQILSSIDGILNDPALEGATGWMSWRQRIPGTESYRFGTRARQLEGQAFLQAFEALKGGGAITEIEGQKATQAIGRLDTAQSAEDYRAALKDLRSVVSNAKIRASGGTVQEPLALPSEAQRQRLRFNPETGDFE